MPSFRFFAFNPRTGRVRWLAWLCAAVALLWACILGLQHAEGTVLVAIYAVLGFGTAKLATESVRRLHDCGQSGRQGIGPVLGIVVLFVTAVLHSIGYGLDGVSTGALVLATMALLVLLLRPGSKSANRFGTPPRLLRPSEQRPAAGGTIAAACFIAAGIGFGLAVLQWQAGMAEQREKRLRFEQNYVEPPDPLSSER